MAPLISSRMPTTGGGGAGPSLAIRGVRVRAGQSCSGSQIQTGSTMCSAAGHSSAIRAGAPE